MADEVDYYAVLGLPASADDATIRLAYRRLARRYHPDIAGDENLHLMQTLNQAYQTLSDPERRRLYDASRPPPMDAVELTQAAQHQPQRPQQPSQQQPHSPTRAVRRPESVTASAGPLRRLAVFDDGEASAVVSVALAQGGAVAAVGHIDGQIALWNATQNRPVTRLALGTTGQAGTLSEVRISADTMLVMAWGFAL
ncbi:MAG TPA: J domain-containing protein, partial [Ktedonobacterales bacterium]